MATLKIIDRKDKFLIEVDGSKAPYVTTYELTRKPSGTVLLHLALAMSEVEIEVESDQITTEKGDQHGSFNGKTVHRNA